MLGRGGESVSRAGLLADRGAQLLDAGGGCVVGFAATQRGRGRFDHGSRGREVGVSDVQAEHGTSAGALHLVGEAEHGSNG